MIRIQAGFDPKLGHTDERNNKLNTNLILQTCLLQKHAGNEAF